MNDISLRRLQVFMTIAETLHMGRAAEQLEIAQPALSQQIKALEQALGAQLFHRRKRGIELTAAGKVCLDESQRLLEQHRLLRDKVRRTARGEIGQLVLGHIGSGMAGPKLPHHLLRMKRHHPQVQIILQEGSIAELLQAVGRQDMDIALVRDPDLSAQGYARQLYLRERLFVLLPEEHPLAGIGSLQLKDIINEPLIGFQDPDQVGITQVIQKLAARTGQPLEPAWKASNISSIFGLVLAGFGIAIVAESVTDLLPRCLKCCPLSDIGATTELYLMWNPARTSPVLRAFIQLQDPGDTAA
ncbi:LysR family transcriptional regulator [Frateuria aurantia]